MRSVWWVKFQKQSISIFSCIFILLSRESDQCAIRARLGDANHLSITPRWGNPAKCLSQRNNKYTFRFVLHIVPLMLSVKQGSCEYRFESYWFDQTRNQTRVYDSRGGHSYHSAILVTKFVTKILRSLTLFKLIKPTS